jgi:hypothetical protein
MSRGRVDRRGEGWTSEHVAQLLGLIAEGKSHAEAASIMDRSISAIKSKIGYLNHPRKRPGAEPRDNPWTPERVAMLVKLWGEGKSAKQIADTLEITRNSAIGRVHRMGLTRNADAVLTPAQKGAHRMTMPKPKVVKVRVFPKPAPPARPPEPATFSGPKVSAITGMRLTQEPQPPKSPPPREDAWKPLPGTTPQPFGHQGCKWPIDSESEPMCCGLKREDAARPYCTAHRKLSINPTSADKKKRLARMVVRLAA